MIEIDPGSVALVGLVLPQSVDFVNPILPQRFNYEDVATPFEPFTGKEDPFDCTTEGPDGFADLTLKFDNQEVITALTQALGQAPQRGKVLVLKVAGNLMDANATPVVGEDVVVVVR